MLILQLIVIQALTFVGLIFLLKKILYANFRKAMRRLEILNRENEKKQKDLQAKIEQTEKDFETKVKETEELAVKRRQEAEAEAEEIRSRALADTEQEREKFQREILEQEDKMRRDLEAQLSLHAARVAADALRYVLNVGMNRKLHRELVEEMIEGLSTLDPKRLNGASREVEVISPLPLEAPEKTKLEQALEKKCQGKMTLNIRMDPLLIAGLVLRFENAVIDGSFKNKLDEAIGYVRKAEKQK